MRGAARHLARCAHLLPHPLSQPSSAFFPPLFSSFPSWLFSPPPLPFSFLSSSPSSSLFSTLFLFSSLPTTANLFGFSVLCRTAAVAFAANPRCHRHFPPPLCFLTTNTVTSFLSFDLRPLPLQLHRPHSATASFSITTTVDLLRLNLPTTALASPPRPPLSSASVADHPSLLPLRHSVFVVVILTTSAPFPCSSASPFSCRTHRPPPPLLRFPFFLCLCCRAPLPLPPFASLSPNIVAASLPPFSLLSLAHRPLPASPSSPQVAAANVAAVDVPCCRDLGVALDKLHPHYGRPLPLPCHPLGKHSLESLARSVGWEVDLGKMSEMG